MASLRASRCAPGSCSSLFSGLRALAPLLARRPSPTAPGRSSLLSSSCAAPSSLLSSSVCARPYPLLLRVATSLPSSPASPWHGRLRPPSPPSPAGAHRPRPRVVGPLQRRSSLTEPWSLYLCSTTTSPQPLWGLVISRVLLWAHASLLEHQSEFGSSAAVLLSFLLHMFGPSMSTYSVVASRASTCPSHRRRPAWPLLCPCGAPARRRLVSSSALPSPARAPFFMALGSAESSSAMASSSLPRLSGVWPAPSLLLSATRPAACVCCATSRPRWARE
ncbi:uncharacterized protein LOC100383107 [Zea mays]|uniref:Uncharacterized protein n=1 Tax=Zea mays TaxID=4577 RepID=C0PD34_MAIZE|nr:uncharacterized protein LOC100383107 [Zea mays]ACN32079.1 unknown [Zea mays]|eukprot:NP_001169248.1 uncharacterized protein LOC100383107 [Zea mays]